MSQAHDAENSGSAFATIISELVKDVRALVRQEMALAQEEARYEISKILKVVLWYGIAAVLTAIGLFIIAAACVLILFEYTGLPAWACAMIVSIAVFGGAWGLAVAGRGVAKSVRVAPLRTIRTLTDDFKWMAEWVRSVCIK